MQLKRAENAKSPISLVPMIDVMLILLVFFMVTSSYLNLDMLPMLETSPEQQPTASTETADSSTLLVRLGADGVPYIRGQAYEPTTLSAFLKAEVQDNPLTSIVLLPSNGAQTQHLVSVMDLATLAGATRLRVIRLEPRE